jgi:hypothetical protein
MKFCWMMSVSEVESWELGVTHPVSRQAEKKPITVDYNKYDVRFLFGQERTPENDYIFSALISLQKSVAQTILYKHHRATFERQKRKFKKAFQDKTEAMKQKKGFRKKIKLLQQTLFIT